MGLGALFRRNELPDGLRTKRPDELAFEGRGPPRPDAPNAVDAAAEPAPVPAPIPGAVDDEAADPALPDDSPAPEEDKLLVVEGMTGEACSAIFFRRSARLV
jgi:hypothetical protein